MLPFEPSAEAFLLVLFIPLIVFGSTIYLRRKRGITYYGGLDLILICLSVSAGFLLESMSTMFTNAQWKAEVASVFTYFMLVLASIFAVNITLDCEEMLTAKKDNLKRLGRHVVTAIVALSYLPGVLIFGWHILAINWLENLKIGG